MLHVFIWKWIKMQFLKFSIIFFCMTLAYSQEEKDVEECLNSTYEIFVNHNILPFGLLKKTLGIKKNLCVIEITSTSYYMIKDHWKVDVCRNPVHLKKGKSSVDVLKRLYSCNNSSLDNEYCNEVKSFKEMIQDDGLVFAEGEKELLSTDHGKVYCVYNLVNNYLDKGLIFSRFSDEVEKSVEKVMPKVLEKKNVESIKEEINKEVEANDSSTSGSSSF